MDVRNSPMGICTLLSLQGMQGDTFIGNAAADGVVHRGDFESLEAFKELIRIAIERVRREQTNMYSPGSPIFKCRDPFYLSAFIVVTTLGQKDAIKHLRELGFTESPTYANVKYASGITIWTIGSFDLCQKVGVQPLAGESWQVGGDPYAEGRKRVKQKFKTLDMKVENVG